MEIELSKKLDWSTSRPSFLHATNSKIKEKRIYVIMMTETATPAFSDISAQDTALAAQEAQEWIEVSEEKPYQSEQKPLLRTAVILLSYYNDNLMYFLIYYYNTTLQAVTGRTFSSSFRKSLEDGVILCE